MEIDDLPPKYQAQARRQLTVRAADAQQAVGDEQVAAEKIARFDRRVSVDVSIKRHRLTDPDEKGGRCKYIIDAFVTDGLLRDDSAKEIFRYDQEQEKVPKSEREGTTLIFEEEE